MKNKGISPLIATVLIIGFTIVAAVLVITWINTLIRDQTVNVDCKTQALDECLDSSGKLEFGVQGDSTSVFGKISNKGATPVDITIVYLDSSGNSICGSPRQPITIAAFDNEIDSTSCSGASKVRFINTITIQVNDIICTETCGNIKIIDVPISIPSSPTCTDGITNQGETDVDCGGICNQCPNGDSCLVPGDCSGGYCVNLICRSTSTYCGDGICNSGETCSSDNSDCSNLPTVDCKVKSCNSGCRNINAPDGTACSIGTCTGGVCTAPPSPF